MVMEDAGELVAVRITHIGHVEARLVIAARAWRAVAGADMKASAASWKAITSASLPARNAIIVPLPAVGGCPSKGLQIQKLAAIVVGTPAEETVGRSR